MSLKSSTMSISFVSDMFSEESIVSSEIDNVILIAMINYQQTVEQWLQDWQTL